METGNSNQMQMQQQTQNLQNTKELQNDHQGNLQQQSGQSGQGSYKQLQQNALGAEAYRDFDGLKVQSLQGTNGEIRDNIATSTGGAWPSPWVWVVAVLVFLAFINLKRVTSRNTERVSRTNEPMRPQSRAKSTSIVTDDAANPDPDANNSNDDNQTTEPLNSASKADVENNQTNAAATDTKSDSAKVAASTSATKSKAKPAAKKSTKKTTKKKSSKSKK